MVQDPRKQRTQEVNNTLVNGSDAEKAALAAGVRKDISTFVWWAVLVPMLAALAFWLVRRAVAAGRQGVARRP